MADTCRSPEPLPPAPLPSADAPDLPTGGVFFIDWDCGFCQRSKEWIRRHSEPDRFLFAALATPQARPWMERCGRDPDAKDTVVHVGMHRGRLRCSTHSTAVLRAVRHMRWPYRLLYAGIMVPRPLRDAVYRWVSRRRHRL